MNIPAVHTQQKANSSDTTALIRMLISSLLLLSTLYFIPVLVCYGFNAGFELWISAAALNLMAQPLLLSTCIYYFFTIKLSKAYLYALFILLNITLFVLPIAIICLIFNTPWNFNFG